MPIHCLEDAIMPPLPGQTYEALGKFLERQAPYTDAELPSFAGNSQEQDQALMSKLSEHLQSVEPFKLDNHDCHVIAAAGPYSGFNKVHPSTKKSEELTAAEQRQLMKWEFDGIENIVTKAIRIEYTHVRKADGKPCHAFILIGFTGDDH
jgi:hypothetical protein